MNVTVNGDTVRSQSEPRQTESEVANIERSCVGTVRADRAELRNVAAGVVFAEKGLAFERGVARAVASGGPFRLTQGGAGTVLAGGDVSINQGGAGTVASLGRTSIEQGGACLLVAGSASIGRGGIVGLALTPRLEVADGGRVFGGAAAAVAAVAGIAIGFAIGALVRGKRS